VKRGLLLVMATIAIMSTVTLASAYAELTADPKELSIDIGSTGSLTLALDTDDDGEAKLKFETDSAEIKANLIEDSSGSETGPGNDGELVFDNTPKTPKTFTLEITPQDGATVNEKHDIYIEYQNKNGEKKKWSTKASVTATVVPVPELSTVALMSAGLLGMIALVRRQRRD